MERLELKRYCYMPPTVQSRFGYTLGQCTYDDYFWYTVERPWLNNQLRISCIPEGTYIMRRYDSPRFGHDMWEVTDVPYRTYILIHKANWARKLLGCIGLGMELWDNGVGNSRIAINEFYHVTHHLDELEIRISSLAYRHEV